MPLLKLNTPVDIEIVPKLKMLFLCKARNLPTPLQLNITYMKNRNLQVETTLSEQDAKECLYAGQRTTTALGQACTYNYGQSYKNYQNCNKILLESQGAKQKDIFIVPAAKAAQLRDKDGAGGHGHQEKKQAIATRAPKHGKHFTENNMYILFSSNILCSIRAEITVPQSLEEKNKAKLAAKRVLLQQR